VAAVPRRARRGVNPFPLFKIDLDRLVEVGAAPEGKRLLVAIRPPGQTAPPIILVSNRTSELRKWRKRPFRPTRRR
jgi:hypothetical protein